MFVTTFGRRLRFHRRLASAVCRQPVSRFFRMAVFFARLAV